MGGLEGSAGRVHGFGADSSEHDRGARALEYPFHAPCSQFPVEDLVAAQGALHLGGQEVWRLGPDGDQVLHPEGVEDGAFCLGAWVAVEQGQVAGPRVVEHGGELIFPPAHGFPGGSVDVSWSVSWEDLASGPDWARGNEKRPEVPVEEVALYS